MLISTLIIYGLFLILMGIVAARQLKSPSDYFVAGKSKGVLQVGGSLLASVLGGAAILGSVNLAHSQMWASTWYLLSAAIGLFCLLPVVKKLNTIGKFTLTNLIRTYYGAKASKIAGIIIPLAWTGIIAAQIIASAKILFTLFYFPYEWGVILSSILFIAYTWIGGQLSILKTDFVQAIIILFGIVLCAGYLFFCVKEPVSPVFNSFPFNANFTGVDLSVLLLSFSSTFVVGPDIYSRIFCAKDARVAKRSVLLSAIILVPFAFTLSYLGIFAVEHLNSNQLQSVALIELIANYFPEWFLGIMAAALLSAVLSSADTTLLTASMMLTELSSPDIDNKQSLSKTRWFILALGTIAMFIALSAGSIINSLLLALAFYSGAFIVPVALALWNCKTNKNNVIWAILAGGLLAITGKALSTFYGMQWGNYLLFSAFAINFLIMKIGAKR